MNHSKFVTGYWLGEQNESTKWESFIELMMITDHLPITRQQQLLGNCQMIFGWSPKILPPTLFALSLKR